jgi:hypothetical protein
VVWWTTYRKVVGNENKALFWKEWIGDSLRDHFSRLFEISLDKDMCVVEMIVNDEGVFED